MMGTETNSATGCSASSSSTTSSPSGKRSRDPKDEVYFDNLHSHKRYLSEIMASSLNGLTVGETIPESLLESPARPEAMLLYSRDEISWQNSPMSDDSEDSRFCGDAAATTRIASSSSSSSQVQADSSPASPSRHQKSTTTTTTTCGLASITCSSSQPRQQQQQQQRGSDSEGRFPSSPSDICHSADLRRAMLLRSMRMRGPHPLAPPPAFEPCSYAKSMVVDDDDDDNEREEEYRTECNGGDKSCRVLNMDVKEDDSSAESSCPE